MKEMSGEVVQVPIVNTNTIVSNNSVDRCDDISDGGGVMKNKKDSNHGFKVEEKADGSELELESGLELELELDQDEGAEEASPISSSSLSIPNTEVSSLIHKMLALGYFHNDNDNDNDNASDKNNNSSKIAAVDDNDNFDEENGTMESMKEYQALCRNRQKFQCDQGCSLLFPSRQVSLSSPSSPSSPLVNATPPTTTTAAATSDDSQIEADEKDSDDISENESTERVQQNDVPVPVAVGINNNNSTSKERQIFCMTRERLKKELYIISRKGGRVSLTTICHQMKLSMDDVHRAANEIVNEKRSYDTDGDVDNDVSSSKEKKEGGEEEEKEEKEKLQQKIYLVQKELITDSFLNDIFQSKVLTKLYKEDGCISISDLAMSFFHLPLDFMLDIVENRLVDDAVAVAASTSTDCSAGCDDGGGAAAAAAKEGGNNNSSWSFQPDVKLTVGNDGVKKIVTAQYEKKRIEEIVNILATANEPVKLIDLFRAIDWDPHEIFNAINRLCNSGQLKGEVHTDNSSSNVNVNITAGAIYIPDAYEQNQKDAIKTLFQTHGYITNTQAHHVGVSVKRLEEHILSDGSILNNANDAMILHSCIIHRDMIVSPLQVIIEECIEMESFVDLSLHVPSEILSCKDDVRTIMIEYVLQRESEAGTEADSDPDPAATGHCVLIEDDEALYFSPGFIHNVSVKILQPLIENYAKVRAKEIVQIIDESKKKKNIHQGSGSGSAKDGNRSKNNHGKSKSKNKSSRKKSMGEGGENDNDTIEAPKAGLPLLKTVVEAIGEVYTDIMDIQDSYDNTENNEESGWDAVVEGGGEYDGPLYGFCRNVLNKDSKLERICSEAVDAEIQKIMKMRQGSSTSMSRKQSAMKCQNIEKLFDEHFPTACHYIQLKAKFPQFLMSSSDVEVSDEEMKIIENDFLHHCAWFAKRITEYCLFKAGLDAEGMFQFSTECTKEDDDEESQDEHFYSPVDVTARFAPKAFLSCTSDKDGDGDVDGDGWKDPLQLLREVMPGNIGVGLARMWINTGGEHYDGGTKISENDDGSRSSYVRPGDANKFLAHVEENCLNIVGIPFKLLDKKVEKKLMFSRRKELTAQLRDATKAEKIYDLSIMLLYQQLRSMIVRVDSCNTSNSKSYNNQEEGDITKVILKHLFDDCNDKKKIPLQVKEYFDQASSLLLLEGEINVPENLIEKIKGCGLSKDISSHVVST